LTHLLKLQRLTLHPVSCADTEFLLAHWSDPTVRRFLFDATPAVADQILQAITDSLRDLATVGYGLWLLRLANSSEPIGTVGLRSLDGVGIEVFYSLTPGRWGNGYATEAGCGVFDYALGPLGLPEVFAEVDVGNTASAAVIERLGMTAFTTVSGALGAVTRYRKPCS
jgi:RimJ/RimL family protein N-acetyltransferase